MKWDNESGIRERLALLAFTGPGLNPQHWGYNPSRNVWYQCGPMTERGHEHRVEVRQEGSASLALIEQRWKLSRVRAMDIIGHPERTA